MKKKDKKFIIEMSIRLIILLIMLDIGIMIALIFANYIELQYWGILFWGFSLTYLLQKTDEYTGVLLR